MTDCVPTKWLKFEKTKVSTQFLDATYDNGVYSEDDLDLLTGFIKVGCTAPDHWPWFEVELVSFTYCKN